MKVDLGFYKEPPRTRTNSGSFSNVAPLNNPAPNGTASEYTSQPRV